MTPDQFLSTMHRQRTDLIALRQAMGDLASCLPAQVRDEWLTALQARTAKARATAQVPNQDPDLSAALEANAAALEALGKMLAQGQ